MHSRGRGRLGCGWWGLYHMHQANYFLHHGEHLCGRRRAMNLRGLHGLLRWQRSFSLLFCGTLSQDFHPFDRSCQLLDLLLLSLNHCKHFGFRLLFSRICVHRKQHTMQHAIESDDHSGFYHNQPYITLTFRRSFTITDVTQRVLLRRASLLR